ALISATSAARAAQGSFTALAARSAASMPNVPASRSGRPPRRGMPQSVCWSRMRVHPAPRAAPSASAVARSVALLCPGAGGPPPADVADHQGVAVGQAEDLGRVDARVDAADNHRLQGGHHRPARHEAVPREVGVAGGERADYLVHGKFLRLAMWTLSTINLYVDSVHLIEDGPAATCTVSTMLKPP